MNCSGDHALKVPTVAELLDEHTTLNVECLDRLYLNAYIPNLQIPKNLQYFLRDRHNAHIASPAILKKVTGDFRTRLDTFVKKHNIPVVKFERGQRKDDIANEYRKHFSDQEGVVFVGVAQEKAYAYKGHKQTIGNWVQFEYSRQSVFVNHYYFYLHDREFGPGFIKICSYAPFTMKVCLNGHEWAKQQLLQRGIEFEALDNGFLSCEDPQQLQQVCDKLDADHLEAFLRRWLELLPHPLTREDRDAGYDYELSIKQMEVSLTQVFDRPLRGRQFFEDVIRDNLDQGRPDRIQLLFERRVQKNTPGRFSTRVIQQGVRPSLHVEYKSTHVKQYFKEERALRTETTINNPRDFGVNKGISNLRHLQNIGRNINRRLLEVQRVSHNCVMSGESIDRVVQPTVTKDGQRAPGFRFGDHRAMALFQALTLNEHLVDGFTNGSLRGHLHSQLSPMGMEYGSSQMSYDLWKLRLKGMVLRRQHSYRYELTPYGMGTVLFLSKLEGRIFRPGFGSMHGHGPMHSAFRQFDRALDMLTHQALGEPLHCAN